MMTSLQQILTSIPIAILFIGIIGNICNIIVFGKRTMRSTSTFRFLFYLSIVDVLVLLFGALDMLIRNDSSLELRDFSLISCNLHKFLTYTVTYVSSFISVAVNIDRAQIVASISMFHMSNTNTKTRQRTNTFNKRFKSGGIRLNKRFVDYIVLVVVVSIVVLNLHYVIFLKTTSIIYVDYDDEDFYGDNKNTNNNNNSNNRTSNNIVTKMRLNASIMKNSDEKFKAFLR